MNENITPHRGSDLFMAFGLGLMAGAITSLLLAPASGEETRRRLNEVARRVGEKAKEGADAARGYVNQTRHRVDQAVQEGKEAFQRSQV